MIRYDRLAFVALNVSDPARSREFYERIVGLEFAGIGSEQEALLRVGEDQHVGLYCGDRPGLKRLGWQIQDERGLDILAQTLARSGAHWREIGPAGIQIVEPNTGVTMDFLVRPSIPGPAPVGAAPVEALGHVVLRTPRYREAVAFFEEVLNFRPSDEIEGRITFLRCFPNALHHSIGVANAERNMLHHVGFLVSSLGVAQSTAKRLAECGVPVMAGPGRHAPSGSTFVYFLDPDGLTLEYSHGMERFAEAAPREPRVLPPGAEARGNRHDARLFAVGEVETANA